MDPRHQLRICKGSAVAAVPCGEGKLWGVAVCVGKKNYRSDETQLAAL